MGNIKILLVGCGYWGKNWYNTIKNSSCELVGVVDPNPILDVDVPLFDNINSVNVDYSHIILSVPPKHVNKIFKDIKIESSKILIEKPCGVSKKDVKKLGEFYPGFIFLNSPHYQYIKKNINKIGKPLFFNSSRASMGPRIRTDVSILEDYLIHDLYIFMGLFGKEISIENVFMSNTFNNPIKSDTINLNLKCGNIRADMFSSWWFPQKTRKLFIIGDKGKNRNDGYELIDSLTEPLIYTSQKSNLELELDNFINNKKLDVTALDVWDLIERIKNES